MTARTDGTAYGVETLRSRGRIMKRTLAVVTVMRDRKLAVAGHTAGHAQDGVRAAGTPLRGEKAPDDALARELCAMGLL